MTEQGHCADGASPTAMESADAGPIPPRHPPYHHHPEGWMGRERWAFDVGAGAAPGRARSKARTSAGPRPYERERAHETREMLWSLSGVSAGMYAI